MYVITFSEAVQLKKYIWEHFKKNLHIHDTCGGGLYFTLDEASQIVMDFIQAYFSARGIATEISKDGRSVFLGESIPASSNKVILVYEADKCRSAAYIGDLLIGECTYTVDNNSWTIDHTYVQDAYRNLGIAKDLVLLVVEEAKKAGVKVIPVCSYAKKILAE